jgi:C4-dicarboxylate-specific signal transduction histidine kinase
LNLILNAADAVSQVTGRARQLVVRTELDPPVGVRLIVSDNGAGIASDDFGRVFEPFFTTKVDGMGIGLSISLDIVERHNGGLTVTQNDDFGVTFLLSLPCKSGATS